MKRLRSHNIGVDQGSVVLFDDVDHGGPMWTGEGKRASESFVKFAEPYREPPVVHVSLSMWDTDQKSNQRADISAKSISNEGFTLLFQTWGDSRIARIRADWMAIGALDDDLDWDVR